TLTCSRSRLKLSLQRSPPRLLIAAAWSGLRPAPESRSQGACPHLSRSFTTVCVTSFRSSLQHTESEELFLVDAIEHQDRGALDDFVFQGAVAFVSRPPSVCTSGERAVADTFLVGPVHADLRAVARGLPRNPPTSRHPLPGRLCA